MGIAVGTLFALIFRVMALFFWGVIGIITARTLTVDDRGVYAAAVIIIGVLSAILSFSSASSYLVANRHRDAGEVAWHGALFSLLAGMVAVAIALISTVFVSSDLRLVAILVGLAIVPSILRGTLGGVLLGTDQLHRFNISGNASPGLGLLLIAGWVGFLHHRSIESALFAWTVAQYLSLLPVLYWGRNWWRPAIRPFDREITHRLLTFGAVTGAATVIAFFNYRVDVLMVIGLDSREGAGIYSSSVALAEALWLFSSAIAVASYARVGSANRAESARLTALGVRHTLIVVVSGAVAVAVLSPILLGVLFGETYRSGAMPLRILCIGTAAYAPATLLSNYFTVQLGRPAIALWLAALSSVISVGAGFALIPAFGTDGAAWATTAGYSASAAISVVIFLRMSNTPASDLWRIRADDILSYFRLARSILSPRALRQRLGARP